MKPNIIEFEVSGRYALFSDPINRMGGEKLTYTVPTYQALKGITESIYWKPTIMWIIDSVRIMKPIRSQSQGIRPLVYSGGNTLSMYSYLYDVKYQVRAHFEWNIFRKELSKDHNENKHHNIAKRYVERGGRRDVFLGTRECQAYVEPCVYGSGQGYYDSFDEYPLGVMFHGFTYPDENSEKKMLTRFWRPVMKKGEICFIRPEECELVRKIETGSVKLFDEKNVEYIDYFDEMSEFGGEILGMD